MALKPIETRVRQQAPETSKEVSAEQKRVRPEAPQVSVSGPAVLNQAAKYQLDPGAVLAREKIITERWRVFWQGLARVSPYARTMVGEAHFPPPSFGKAAAVEVGDSSKRLV